MKIAITDVLDSVYAHSALMAIGSRNRPDRMPAILHRDHAEALARVVRDAAPCVAEWLAPAGVRGCAYRDAEGCIEFDGLPDSTGAHAAGIVRNALVHAALHIAYGSAGIETAHIDTARRLAERLSATHRPVRATMHYY